MYRFITWFNSLKVRLKSKRFIIPIIFALTLLFFPKDAFALEIDNVKFFNNNQLVHTFTKQDLQGGYASVDPVLVDAFHINYVDANLKTNYVYDFEANFNMAGNRLFNDVVDFFVYASPFGSISNLLTSTDSWFLYSAEQVSPYYNGEYVVNSSFTSTVNSNNLRFQYDLGDELILSSFRLNSAKLTNDGQDVGDVISNQTQELLENQNKNQQQTNERLDELKKQFESCRPSKNLIWSFYTTGYKNQYSSQLYIGMDLKPNTTYTLSFVSRPTSVFYPNESLFVDNPYVTVGVDRTYIKLTTKSTLPTDENNVEWGWRTLKNGINFDQAPLFEDVMVTLGDNRLPYEPPGEICKNKIDETNEKLDNLDKTLNDDNVSGATSTGNDFFDNFNSKDNGGISRIVTMPLTLINGLISGGTCSNLEFEVLGKEVYFPSGCILWQNAPSAIVTIYRTIICGLFSYILATHLFKDIEDLKNPNKEEVSTLDL